MKLKFGIANKLFLGFGSMIVLSLLTSAVMWDRFQDIAHTQQSVIDHAIPAMNEAQRLAELSAAIIASAPELLKVNNEQRRAETFENISMRVNQVDDLLSRVERHDFDREQVDSLTSTIHRIIENVTQLDSLVRIRLNYERRNRALTASSIKAVKQLTTIAESLVANTGASTTAVVSTIYDLIERAGDNEQVYGVLDRLLEVELDGQERMFELRLRGSILEDQLQQISTELDPVVLAAINQEIEHTLAIIGRRIDDINDPGRFEQASDLLDQLEVATRPGSRYAFLRTRQVIVGAMTKSDQLSSDNHILLERLNEITEQLVEKSQQAIEQATRGAEQSVSRARLALLIFGVLSPVILLAIFLFYVSGMVKRITRLETATQAISSGDYTIDIDTAGADELSAVARAVQLFKEHAIEKVKLDKELKKHKQNLEKTVAERTLQLQQSNRNLQQEAEQHALARQQAEHASRAKTTFLAMMSHEIRTPMNGILGTLRLLNNTSLTEKQRFFTNVINSASRSLLGILNDVLDFSAIEAGRVEIEPVTFDLKVLIDEVITLMKPAAQDKNLYLTADLGTQINTRLTGDAGKLRQILLNLVNNAIKFTEQGGVRLQVNKTASEAARVSLTFNIIDTGIGIEEEMIKAIFEPFLQVDTSLSKNAGGIGLGLAICQRLVVAMGGTIHASRPAQGGVCMTVQLDFACADEQSRTADESHDERVSDTVSGKFRVLLVEDDAVNRMVSQSFLEEYGHRVIAVTEAEAALKEHQQNDFDIILTDISLPGMDGLELTKRIRGLADSTKAQIPIVAISAHVLQQEVDSYQHSGISAFLGKPYEPDKLNDVLQRCVSHQESGQFADYQPASNADMDCRDVLLRDVDMIGEELVEDMVEVFFSSTRETLVQLEQALASQAWPDVEKLAHKLKSATSCIGLNELWRLASELEAAAQQDRVKAARLQAQLTELYERQCQHLRRVWRDIKRQRAAQDA